MTSDRLRLTPTASFVRADAFSSIRGGRLSSSCAHGIHVSFFSNDCWAEMFSSPLVTSFAADFIRHVPSTAIIICITRRHYRRKKAALSRRKHSICTFFSGDEAKAPVDKSIFFAKISPLLLWKTCEKKVYNFTSVHRIESFSSTMLSTVVNNSVDNRNMCRPKNF